MISDKLYERVFLYKKTRLWDKLWDSEIFAVKLHDGRIGYISIAGAEGEHCALRVYVGSRGIDSFRRMIRANQFMMRPSEFQEQMLQQECLQCSFESKSELAKEEQEEVQQYARAKGIRLAGKGAYPQFTKYQKNLCPWYLQTEEDQEILGQALEAAAAFAAQLKGKMPDALGMEEIGSEAMEIPMMEYREGTYVLTKTMLPKEEPVEVPTPEAVNQIGLAKLKKLKKSGVWECGIIRVPQPIRNDPEEIPFFPVLLLAVNSIGGQYLSLPPLEDYEDNPCALVDIFMEGLLKQKICPKEILARDERTYAFAEDLCGKLGIALSIGEKLEALDEVEDALLEHISRGGDEEIADFVDMLDSILNMDEKRQRELPDGISKQLKEMLDHGGDMLPPEIRDKAEQIIHMLEKDGTVRNKKVSNNIRKLTPNISYVISVSLGTGCYRHIQISGESTLFQLHSAILDAFGFIDDHAHAFFMNNSAWSDRDSYYAENVERGLRLSAKYRLSQVDLYKGKQFKYVFDFGDEWMFQCKVLKVAEGSVSEPTVVRSKGEPPCQYGDWDDEWDDE